MNIIQIGKLIGDEKMQNEKYTTRAKKLIYAKGGGRAD